MRTSRLAPPSLLSGGAPAIVALIIFDIWRGLFTVVESRVVAQFAVQAVKAIQVGHAGTWSRTPSLGTPYAAPFLLIAALTGMIVLGGILLLGSPDTVLRIFASLPACVASISR